MSIEQIELENEDEIIFDSAETDEQVNLSSKRTIIVDQKDQEVNSLHGQYLKGRLNLQPSFQRKFVWDKRKSSSLIESALLGIPIPAVYLSEEYDGKYNVIDGQQRLNAFFSFISGKFPDGKEFRLEGLTSFTDINGQKFKELSEDLQEKITGYAIRVIRFLKNSDSDLQFEIFARLNTGSVSLNDQEMRNCVYRGTFNDLLGELSKNTKFRSLLGIKTEDKRMMDRELVLRFAAFHLQGYTSYPGQMKSFLNNTMKKHQNMTENEAKKLRKAFNDSVDIISTLLEKRAFKRFYRGSDDNNRNGRWEEKKINHSLFDILMWSFARENKNNVHQNLDRIREALIDLMTCTQDFIDSIERSTSSKKAVETRFSKWQMALQSILGISVKEPRCFSKELKKDLFDRNKTCKICGNEILNIDDAAVDHIVQYWTGGKTIPENARLTHRYCNNARPRTD